MWLFALELSLKLSLLFKSSRASLCGQAHPPAVLWEQGQAASLECADVPAQEKLPPLPTGKIKAVLPIKTAASVALLMFF